MIGLQLPSRYDLGLSYIEEGLLLTTTSAWGWYTIETSTYDFFSDEQREQEAAGMNSTLAGLVGHECHLLLSAEAYDVQAWRQRACDTAPRGTKVWPSYLNQQSRYLSSLGFFHKHVHLGVRLDTEHKSVLPALLRRTEAAAGITPGPPPLRQIEKWRKRLMELDRKLHMGRLPAARASAPEIRHLIQRNLWRGLPSPPQLDWEQAESEALPLLLEGRVRNAAPAKRSVEIAQSQGSSFVTMLAAARFPDIMQVNTGGDWLSRIESQEWPIEASWRFRLVHPREARNDAEKKLKEITAQTEHILQSNAEVPLALAQSRQDVRELGAELERNPHPVVYGHPRLCVYGSSLEEVEDRAGRTIEYFRNDRIDLVAPSGLQLKLFLESFPGDRVRTDRYAQRQSLSVLGGSLFTATTELGDGIGPYIGQTTSTAVTPVHLDPHNAPRQQKSGGIAVIGSPGGGKSNAAFLLAVQTCLRGGWTLYIDPKSDSSGLARFSNLIPVKIIDLVDYSSGVLDPWAVSESSKEGRLNAVDITRLLLPGRLTTEQESALSQACKRTAELPTPSLTKVVEVLHTGDKIGRQLGHLLGDYQDLPLSELLFGRPETSRLDPAGLTVIQIRGLDIPATTQRSEMTQSQRLSSTLLHQVVTLCNRIVTQSPRWQETLVAIDECHIITSQPGPGRSMIPRLCRTGRSFGTSVALISQNATDLLDQTVTQSITQVLAFRHENPEAARDALTLLGIEPTPANIQELCSLRNGECIYRDLKGRVSTMQVDLMIEDWRHAFDTNPHRSADPLDKTGMARGA